MAILADDVCLKCSVSYKTELVIAGFFKNQFCRVLIPLPQSHLLFLLMIFPPPVPRTRRHFHFHGVAQHFSAISTLCISVLVFPLAPQKAQFLHRGKNGFMRFQDDILRAKMIQALQVPNENAENDFIIFQRKYTCSNV